MEEALRPVSRATRLLTLVLDKCYSIPIVQYIEFHSPKEGGLNLAHMGSFASYVTQKNDFSTPSPLSQNLYEEKIFLFELS